MAQQKASITTTLSTIRKFDYSNEGITLNFSLQVDNKDSLRKFLVCLKAAVTDVEREIKK